MPNIIVKVPEGIFDAASRERLAKGITAAAKTAENIGDDPRHEFTTWVVIEELKAGYFFAGGNDPVAQVLPAIVLFLAPAGVLSEDRRAEAVRLIHAAVVAAKPENDPRKVLTSIIVSDVLDGTWGGSGGVWRLPDFAKAAGYKHLQHLVVA